MYAKRITPDFPDLNKVETLAREAFPPEEYLAPRELIAMDQRGELDFLALYDGAQFVGFMTVCAFESLAYLFFLAVDPALRSHGYGGQALALLETLYPGRQQVVDLEMPDAQAPNNAQRISRRGFYLRHGYRATGHFLSYLGVDYEILCKESAFDLNAFQRMMKTFRIEGFHPRYFSRPLDSL